MAYLASNCHCHLLIFDRNKELACGFTSGLSSLLVVFSKLYNSPESHSAPIYALLPPLAKLPNEVCILNSLYRVTVAYV